MSNHTNKPNLAQLINMCIKAKQQAKDICKDQLTRCTTNAMKIEVGKLYASYIVDINQKILMLEDKHYAKYNN